MEKGLIGLETVDIREFTHDRHRTVDDYPYGGGPGMVMKPEPLPKKGLLPVKILGRFIFKHGRWMLRLKGRMLIGIWI